MSLKLDTVLLLWTLDHDAANFRTEDTQVSIVIPREEWLRMDKPAVITAILEKL